MERKPVRILRSILAGVLLFALVAAVVLFFNPPTAAKTPHIVPGGSGAQAGEIMVTHTFPFGKTNVTIAVPVNYSVYAGAQRADKRTYIAGNTTESESDFYRSMINDPSQEQLYLHLLSRFREIRSERNLSDDEYLELITVYTQSLPFEISEAPAKFPVETVMEGTGDCDDKSLLLAGLLSREGYPVVLFLFGPEQHMALGVGSDAFPYKSTGYAYIEATDYSFVGVPSYTMKGNGTLKSDPLVIPIAGGTKRYQSGSETSYIDNMSALSGRKAAELSLSLRGKPSASWENRSEYLAAFSRLDHYSDVHNYVLGHKFDRPGVYEYLKREMGG